MKQQTVRIVAEAGISIVEILTANLAGRHQEREVRDEIARARGVVVDFSQVTRLESQGLATILGWIREASKKEIPFVICGLSRAVRMIVEMVQLHECVDLYRTKDDAIRAMAIPHEKETGVMVRVMAAQAGAGWSPSHRGAAIVGMRSERESQKVANA